MTNKIVMKCVAYVMCVWGVFLASCSTNEEPKPADCGVSTLALTVTSTNPSSCSATDGSISVTATGGKEPYTFAIDAQTFGNSSDFTGLGSGTFTVKVRDNNNCDRSKEVTITPMGTTLAATLEVGNSGCKTSNGMISINATGGTEPYLYQLNSGTATDENTFSNLGPGNYIARITDSEGCSITQSVKVLNGTSFATDVQNIIASNCAISGCHVSGGAAPISFTTFSNVQSRASLIKSKTQSGEMPKGAAKLPQAQLDLISCWVDDGALNN